MRLDFCCQVRVVCTACSGGAGSKQPFLEAGSEVRRRTGLPQADQGWVSKSHPQLIRHSDGETQGCPAVPLPGLDGNKHEL